MYRIRILLLIIAFVIVSLVFNSCAKVKRAVGAQEAVLENKDAFTLAILPDTQIYARSYPEILMAQTEWIAKEKDNLNIRLAVHEGDITHNNSELEWERAKRSMDMLDGKVPYAVAPGNHDLPGIADSRDTAMFNRYFPYNHLKNSPSFGGVYEEGRMDNSYHLFSAGGIDWLVLMLEFGPRDEVLEWANEITSYYSNRKAIVVTHAYLYSDNTLIGSSPEHEWTPSDYPIAREGSANNGVEMWDKFVRKHENILFVFSGHVLNDGTGTLVSRGDNGNFVYQMLANYQMNEMGGEGFLRLLEVDPEKGQVSVKTYSPYTGEFKDGPENEFVFENVSFR